MSKQIHIFELYDYIDKKLKRALPKTKYEAALKKIDSMIGLIYGSITGLMCGAMTQPIGAKAAAQRYGSELPFFNIKDALAIQDPILGQLLLQLAEFSTSKWDSTKYKAATNYKTVMCNSSSMKIELQTELVEQIRTGKSASLYNLSGEDFYSRVPLCALFGDATIDTVIGKVLQTHTSFEAPAYALLTASVIQLVLVRGETLISISDWNQIIDSKLVPLLTEYYKIYSASCIGEMSSKTEADKLRIDSMRARLDSQYETVKNQLMSTADLFKGQESIAENIDHLSPEEKEEYKFTQLFVKQLDELKLDNKSSSHPMILAIWCVKAISKIHEAYGMDNIEHTFISSLILREVAIRSGMSVYNCTIVGAILGCIVGCTQLPEMF